MQKQALPSIASVMASSRSVIVPLPGQHGRGLIMAQAVADQCADFAWTAHSYVSLLGFHRPCPDRCGHGSPTGTCMMASTLRAWRKHSRSFRALRAPALRRYAKREAGVSNRRFPRMKLDFSQTWLQPGLVRLLGTLGANLGYLSCGETPSELIVRGSGNPWVTLGLLS